MVKKVSLSLALAALSACGGEEPTSELGVHITGTSALEGVANYEVRIFGQATPCSGLMANPVEARRYTTDCDAASEPNCLISQWSISPDGGRGRISGVPVGTVTVSVIGVDSTTPEPRPVGQGCVAGVSIEEKKAAQVEVQLQPVP